MIRFGNLNGSCGEYTLRRSDQSSQSKRMDLWKHEDRPILGCEVMFELIWFLGFGL